MKDYSDPDLDGALIAAIHHECFLMKASHDEFIRLGEKQILAHLSPTEQVQLFSSYSSFLHHLYEFYVACFMRDQGTDKGFSGIPGAMKKDALFQGEAKRVFSSIVHRLRSGKGQGWENDIEDYDVEIPSDFGAKFRKVRNCTAHAITDRTSGEVDLSDFYENYHKYAYELFRAAFMYWGRYEIDQLDMKAIGRFTVITSEHARQLEEAKALATGSR